MSRSIPSGEGGGRPHDLGGGDWNPGGHPTWLVNSFELSEQLTIQLPATYASRSLARAWRARSL